MTPTTPPASSVATAIDGFLIDLTSEHRRKALQLLLRITETFGSQSEIDTFVVALNMLSLPEFTRDRAEIVLELIDREQTRIEGMSL